MADNLKLHQIPEACNRLGVGRSKLYAMQKSGDIRFVKFAGRTLVPSSEVDRLITEAMAAAA